MVFEQHDDTEIVLSDGPTSTVTRIESDSPNGPRLIAVKTSTTAHCKEPHDIIKEVRLLAPLSHPNIIPLIDQELARGCLHFKMPYMPYSLDQLLRSCGFSPHPLISFANTSSSSPTPREIQFVTLAKSIIFQVLYGVSYLHSKPVQIAHRDIKPSNVLLSPSGRAQLIDFGIAFRPDEDGAAKTGDLWPESTGRMYFEVSTGPYRAPELLFGPRAYDAFAIDAWSLGATFVEFFTSLRLATEDDDTDDVEDAHRSESETETDGEPTPAPTPFVIPRGMRPGMPTGRWTRTSLFDGTRGELGLVWSIFKIRGKPDEATWPSFLILPDASKLSFVDVDAVDLRSVLPNLPPTDDDTSLETRTHAPPLDMAPFPLDLVHRFLVYEPCRRLYPSQALDHPWFKAEPRLILPTDIDRVGDDAWTTTAECVSKPVTTHTVTLEGKTHTLGDLLQRHVTSKG